MNQSETLLEIKDLCVEFKTMAGTVHAVDHLSYTLHRGEKLGIVGESGSGKSTLLQAILQLPGYDAADPKSSGQSHRRTDLI